MSPPNGPTGNGPTGNGSSGSGSSGSGSAGNDPPPWFREDPEYAATSPVGRLALGGVLSILRPPTERDLLFGTASRLLVDTGFPPAARLAVTLSATGGGVTLFMAFLVFGKRRRDGEPPAPEEVLAAAAARYAPPVPSATLVRDGHVGPAFGNPDGLSAEELAMPRWRRPSLLQARKADPLRAGATSQTLTFDQGSAGPIDGHERRRLRYRLVRLLDQPDELRGSEIGFLDEGDEVLLLERSGAYWLVLSPDGSRGWIHKMTLGDAVEPEEPAVDTGRRSFAAGASSPGAFAAAGAAGFGPAGFDAGRRSASGSRDELDGVDDDVVTAFLAARGSALGSA